MPADVSGKQGENLGLAHGTSPKKGIRIPGGTSILRISLSTLAFSLISACLIILIPANSPATEVTIAWSPSTTQVAGYKIYYGPTNRDDQFKVDVGKNTAITITNVEAGGAYSFIVLTYDSAGRESRYSNKTTVLSLKDKDTHFLSVIPSGTPSPSVTPGPPVQEKILPEASPGCEFVILPRSQSVGSSGGGGAVGISTKLNCPWTAVTNVSWATITSNSSGIGNEVVYYLVKANPNATSREGTLTVAGQSFKITQTGQVRHALSPTRIGTGTGTVASAPAGTDFEAGTVVTLSAAPSANSDFAGWSGGCSGMAPVCSVILNSSTSVNAHFKLKTFVISAKAGANGSITPSGRIVVNHGGSQRFIFKPNKGFKIGQIRVDGVSVGKTDFLSLGNVMSPHRIDAIFRPFDE